MTTAELNILIRVRAAEAQAEIARMRAQLAMLEAQTKKSQAASNGDFFSNLSKSGSRMQWVGRQLTAHLTLPFALAAGAATKWAVENEAAMARVGKLYDPVGVSADAVKNELAALDKVATQLSNTFGVNKKVVLDVAGDWAAAGSSGLALAKSMELTMRAMVIGEMDAHEATQALIAIQAQYGTTIEGSTDATYDHIDSVGGLRKILYQLNAVENVTATKLSDLVVAYSRAAGVARTAGVTTGELAAMVAALTPAAGTASEAGTSLKTMISRLLSPTEDANELLNEMGLKADAVGWSSLTATERLKLMSGQFEELTQDQKAVVSSYVASRYHINKFEVLMRELGNTSGYYAKAMEVVNDEQEIFRVAQKELQTVLGTSQHKFQSVGNIIKNALTDAFIPLIPTFVFIAQSAAKVFQAFSQLNPSIQKLIIFTGLFLALLGPTVIMIGLAKLAIGQLAPLFIMLGKAILLPLAPLRLLGPALMAPFTLTAWAAGRVVALTGALLVSRAALGGWSIAAFAARAAMVAFTGGMFIIMRAFPLMMAAASGAWMLITAGAAAAWKGIQFITANGAHGTAMIQTAASAVWAGITSAALAAQRALHSVHWFMVQVMTLNYMSTIFALQQAWYRAQYALEYAWHGIRLAAESLFQTTRALFVNRGYQLQMSIGLMWHALILAADRFFHTTRIGMAIAYWAWYVTTTKTYQAVVFGLTAAWHATMTALQVMWGRVQQQNAIMIAMGLTLIERTFNNLRLIAETVFQSSRAVIVATYNKLIMAAYQVWIVAMLALQRIFSVAWLTNVAALMSKTLLLFRTGLMALLANVKRILLAVAAAFLSPWGVAIAAVIALIVAFKDQIWAAIQGVIGYFRQMPEGVAQGLAPIGGMLSAVGNFFSRIFNGIRDVTVRAFNALPQSIRSALEKVVATVRGAALAVYNWMKYMNPFQRHSPSLVESVTAGMEIVGDKFGAAAARIKTHVMDMYASMQKLNEAVRNGPIQTEKEAQREDKRNSIRTVDPGALASYDDLVVKVEALRDTLDEANEAIERQEKHLESLQAEIDAADKAIEGMTATLDGMKKAADGISQALDAAKDRFDFYKNATIAGTGEMEDAIFNNEMAQKRLQLQIARMGDTSDIESAADAYKKLQGEIEMLSGTQKDLRAKGAGSEILGPYQAMIDSLESQQQAVEDGTAGAAGQIERLNNELEELRKQAEIMDLEKSLKLDPLNRQIDKFVNATTELPFQDIMSGMRSSSAQVDVYTMSLENANRAIAAQEAAIKSAEAARDGMKENYDLENDKLQEMKNIYDSIEESIRAGEAALEDMVTTADAAIQRAEEAARKAEKKKKKKGGGEEEISNALQNFYDAGTGDFEDPGGLDTVGREGGVGDQSGDMIDYANEVAAALGGDLANFDMFAPIKDMWNKAWTWIKDTFGPLVEPLKTMFGDLGNTIAAPFKAGEDGASRLGEIMQTMGGWFSAIWDPIQTAGSALWNLFGPDIVETLKAVWGGLQDMWNDLWPALKGLFMEIGPLIQQLLPYIGWIVAAFLGVIEIVWEMLNGAIRPVFKMIGEVIAGVINVIKGIVEVITGVLQTFKGVVQVIFGVFQTVFGAIKGLFTGDWSTMFAGLGTIGDGFKNIFFGILDVIKGVWHTISGIWDSIVGIFRGAINTIVGVVGGFIQGIWDFFYWLWDELVGHSIVPDMINGIIQWFLELPGKILGMIGDFIAFIWNAFWSLPGKIFEGLGMLGQMLWDLFQGAWNWLVESFPGWVDAVVQFFRDLPGNMLNALGDLAGFVGGFILDQFDRSIRGWGMILQWVADWAKGVPNSLVQGFGNVLQIGIDFVMGFWNGLKEKGQWLKDKIIEWVKDHIPGPIKDVLGIESPSRLMKEYGEFTAEGFAIGMDNGSAGVSAAATDMARAAAQAVAAADVPALQAPTVDGVTAPAEGIGIDPAAADAAMDAVLLATGAFTTNMQSQFSVMHDGVLASVTDMYVQMTVLGDTTYATITASTTTFTGGMLTTFQSMHTAILGAEATYQATMTSTMQAMIEALLKHFTTYKDSLIQLALSAQEGVTGQFNTLAQNLSNIFNEGIKPIFDSFKPMLDQVVDWFGETVGSIGTVWGGIKEPVAVPARFVINDVYNDGIRGAWNKFNTFLDLDPLDEHRAKFATGGPVRGAGTAVSDSIPALLSNDEHVIPAREVWGAGGHHEIEKVRAIWRSGKSIDEYIARYALGGPVDTSLWNAVSTAFPGIQLNSAHRPGHSGYHGKAQAIDISPYQPAADWIFKTYPQSAQLIWGPGPVIAEGNTDQAYARHYFRDDLAGHYDHIHWASRVPIDSDGKMVGAFTGGSSFDMVQYVTEGIKQSMDAVQERMPALAGGIGQWPPRSIDKGRTMLTDFLVPLAEEYNKKAFAANVGAGVEQWRETVKQVLLAMALPLSWTDITLAQMMTESSGNPRAINLTDSNAAKGTPSKGLMQVIDPTFDWMYSMFGPKTGYPKDIWNPHSNIAAGLQWAVHRYGSPFSAGWGNGHGYDQGGILEPTPGGFGTYYNHTGKPEMVLTQSDWNAIYEAANNPVDVEMIEEGATKAIKKTAEVNADTIEKAIEAGSVAAATTWTPTIYDAAKNIDGAAHAMEVSADVTTDAMEEFVKVGGKIQEYAAKLSEFGLTVMAAAQAEEQTWDTWVPVINGIADLLAMLPDAEPEYVPWAGYDVEYNNQMRLQEGLTTAGNAAKGIYQFFKDVTPSILRHTATIGSAVTALVAQNAPIVSAALAMLPVNPVGAAIMLIPVILQGIFTLVPMIIAAIMDIVPTLFSAIKRLIQDFFGGAPVYDDLAAAQEAVIKNEQQIKDNIANPGKWANPNDTTVRNQGTADSVNINIYGDVTMPNVTNNDGATVFVDNLTNMAKG